MLKQDQALTWPQTATYYTDLTRPLFLSSFIPPSLCGTYPAVCSTVLKVTVQCSAAALLPFYIAHCTGSLCRALCFEGGRRRLNMLQHVLLTLPLFSCTDSANFLLPYSPVLSSAAVTPLLNFHELPQDLDVCVESRNTTLPRTDKHNACC